MKVYKKIQMPEDFLKVSAGNVFGQETLEKLGIYKIEYAANDERGSSDHRCFCSVVTTLCKMEV